MSAPEITKEEADEVLAQGHHIRMSMQQARFMAEHLGMTEHGAWRKITAASAYASENAVPLEHNPILTLARAGAAVLFPGEEDVERMARAIYYLAPPLEWIETGGTSGHSGAPIPFEDVRSGSYRKTAERHARAAIAAMEP